MSGVAVLIPVLDRPQNVRPLVDSLTASEAKTQLTPIFFCSPNDDEEIEEVKATGAPYEVMEWAAGFADYAKKLNHGYRRYRKAYEWCFLAADDVEFTPGWADVALAAADGLDVCVIGTNDTVNVRVLSGLHSTHSLVHRDYLACGTIDRQGVILCEEYGHWYVDDEFVQTAIWRNVFVHATEALVVHNHPNYGGALDDATYDKGQQTVGQDWHTYEGRKGMWGK